MVGHSEAAHAFTDYSQLVVSVHRSPPCSCSQWTYNRAYGHVNSRLRQRHHTAPELRFAAHINIILAGECELTISAHSEDGETGAERLDGCAFAHQDGLDASRDHHPGAWINRESAQLNTMPVNVLD